MKKIIICIFALLTQTINATTLVCGDATTTANPKTFSQAVSAKAFDRTTGTLYVVLQTGAGDFEIPKQLTWG